MGIFNLVSIFTNYNYENFGQQLSHGLFSTLEKAKEANSLYSPIRGVIRCIELVKVDSTEQPKLIWSDDVDTAKEFFYPEE